MKAHAFDKRFDAGEDVGDQLDWSQAQRPNLQSRRVNVDVPNWMLDRLDREAERLGVTRQALIKLWIAERVD